MGIPYRFDPMGTLGAERPYVQPIMTSSTTWSNTIGEGAASFGMTVRGVRGQRKELAYELFDGINTAQSSWPSYSPSIAPYFDAEMDFMGRQLKIVSIVTTGYWKEENWNNNIQIFAWNGEMNGDERVFVPVSAMLNHNGRQNLLVPVTSPAFYKAYRIRISSQSFISIQEVKLNAVYRP